MGAASASPVRPQVVLAVAAFAPPAAYNNELVREGEVEPFLYSGSDSVTVPIYRNCRIATSVNSGPYVLKDVISYRVSVESSQ